MTQKIIFLKGLPASGKSTWAKEYIAFEDQNAIRVNKDDIRMQLHKGVFSKENEKEVIDYQMNQAATGLAEGKTVIVDNTHLSGNHELDFRQLANDFDVEFEVKSFLDVPCHICIERDSKREGQAKVGSKVIFSMAKKAGLLAEVQEFAVVPMDSNLPRAIIVDIDGTVAKMNGRSPYDYSRVSGDTPNERVINIIHQYLKGDDDYGNETSVIFLSGRPDSCKNDTETWLNKNIPFHYNGLLMRKEGDKRKDSIIKYEILLDLAKEFNIIASFDDRDQVCKMWREAGLLCLQVANGNF